MQTEAIFNLNKSKKIVMILLALYNADKFSEQKQRNLKSIFLA